MKRAVYLLLCVTCFGCVYEGHTLGDYLKDPRSIIKDPHFADYKEQRDALERQYLRDEITYADYVEKMDALDEKYAKEVQERNARLSE